MKNLLFYGLCTPMVNEAGATKAPRFAFTSIFPMSWQLVSVGYALFAHLGPGNMPESFLTPRTWDAETGQIPDVICFGHKH